MLVTLRVQRGKPMSFCTPKYQLMFKQNRAKKKERYKPPGAYCMIWHLVLRAEKLSGMYIKNSEKN